ncbi:MAG: Type 1 glutamine amidotransferase-like domain-containing protein [Thermoplasmata archaeon]
MKSQIIVLQGGEDVRKRTDKELMKTVFNLSGKKNILVIPWTSESDSKEFEYRKILKAYFSDIGFNEVTFLEKFEGEYDINNKISSVDVIYLPGGDPEILYREMKIRSIDSKLKNFKGIIIGNSAGAIILSRGSIIEKRFFQGFGLVNFYVFVHFNLYDIHNFNLEPGICIPENSWICVDSVFHS